MTTTVTIPAWLPIVISLAALVIAALSLGWNIYKDVVLRARVIVSVAVRWISPGDGAAMFDKIIVSAVNYGPGKVRFSGLVQMRNAPIWRRFIRRVEWFVVNPEWDSPYATKLPALLDVGDEMAVVFPYDAKCFLGAPVTDVGLRDSFGPFHWTPRREVRRSVRQFKNDFQQVNGEWNRVEE